MDDSKQQGGDIALVTEGVDATPSAPAPAFLPQLPVRDANRPRFGLPFGALIAVLLIFGSLLVVLNVPRLILALQLAVSPAHMDMTALAFVVYGGGIALASLSLLVSSRRRGLIAAVSLHTLTCLLILAITIHDMMRASSGEWPALLMTEFLDRGPMVAAGAIAFLVTAPRMEQLYPRRRSDRRDAQRVEMRRRRLAPARLATSWLGLLILTLLIPLPWCWMRIAEEPALVFAPDILHRFLVMEGPFLVEFVFAVACLGLIGLLLLRRRWSSIRITIAFLWLAPTLGVVWFIIDRSEAMSQGILVLYPAGFGIDWFAALAWTCYLLEAPQVHRLYPGGRRYRDLVTDVDVF